MLQGGLQQRDIVRPGHPPGRQQRVYLLRQPLAGSTFQVEIVQCQSDGGDFRFQQFPQEFAQRSLAGALCAVDTHQQRGVTLPPDLGQQPVGEGLDPAPREVPVTGRQSLRRQQRGELCGCFSIHGQRSLAHIPILSLRGSGGRMPASR